MSVAAVGNQLLRLGDGVVKVLRLVHRQHGAELFVRELLGDVHALDLADENLGAFGNRHAGERRDGYGLLTDDFGVQRAVDDDGMAHLVELLTVEEVAAARLELLFDLGVELFVDDDALLRRANHAVVEGLGVDNRVDRQQNVRGFVDDGRGVAGADAQRRLAAGVGSLDHAGAAGGEDAVSLLHQHVGQLQRGNVNPADDVLGSACRNRSLQNNLGGGDSALFGARMGADDDAVARFQAHKRLENRGRGGVGGGNNSGNHADGLGNSLGAEHLVFLNNAAGFDVLVRVVNILGRKVVLDDLVLHNAHAGFLHCHLGKRQARAVGGGGGGKENLVNLFLRKCRKFPLRGSHTGERGFKGFDAVYDRIFFVVHKIYPLVTIVPFTAGVKNGGATAPFGGAVLPLFIVSVFSVPRA